MIKSLFGGFTALVILILISTMVVIPVLADGNGKIAYMASDTGSLGHFEIWVMDDDGTSPVQLTTDTEWDGQPAWSPDGTKIAFVGSHYSNADIWVMDADGSNPVQVTTHAADDYDPAWSRDGTKIAFGSDRDADPETRNDIWVIDADGSNPVQLTTDPAQDTNPTWSPDGTKIAFSSHLYDNGDIFVVDADGSNRVQVTTHHYNDINPAWSSDSSQIVYASWGDDDTWDIWKVNADGRSLPVQLTSGPAYEYSPSWYGEPEGDCVNDLQAVSGSGSVHLTWTDTGASSYAVYRGTMSGGPYVYLGSVSNPQYNDLTVTVGTTYYYVVRTVDPTGQEICQSNEVQVIVSENVPEFPSVILPEVCIIGILSVIFFIRRK